MRAPVMGLFCRIARTLHVIVVSCVAAVSFGAAPCAHGAPAVSPPPSAIGAPHANAAGESKASIQGAESRINTANIVKRVNGELGIDLEATTKGWQRDLDRLESDLARPRLRYSELNRYRDELQRIHSETDDVFNRIQPQLDADRAQMRLLGPAPAADQPPEPEQAALGRAELNYHFGLLSAGQGAINSTNLRIDNLLSKIQEIRRKNFASALFQPIPGVYAYDTWANLPDYVPQAAEKLRELIADWWRDVQDRSDIARVGIEAFLMSLLLSFASWRGVPQAAAPERSWRAAILATRVFGGRSDLSSRGSGRDSCRFLVWHDRQRGDVARADRLAVLFDRAIDRDRLRRGGAGDNSLCSGRTAMASHCYLGCTC